MGAKKRCRHQIVSEILDICAKGSRYTNIMNAVEGSGDITMQYLKRLVANGFINEVSQTRCDAGGKTTTAKVYYRSDKGLTLQLAIQNVDAIFDLRAHKNERVANARP